MITSVLSCKLEQIATCVYDKVERQEDRGLGLFDGEFGVLLFLFYYQKYFKDSKNVNFTYDYAERLIGKIDINRCTYSGGVAGILCLFHHLRKNDFVDIDASGVKSDVASLLGNMMRKNNDIRFYDFMHGALGMGLYFMQSGEDEYTSEMINHLYRAAIVDSDNGYCKWKMTLNGTEGYDISLSHGLSSIIVYLSRAIKVGIEVEKASELLVGAADYILSQEMNFKQAGFHFPGFSERFSLQKKDRLAWCYGDLGIAVSLWQAGQVMGNDIWKSKALEVFKDAMQRADDPYNGVLDAGICHGSAGIAMMYRRMYLESKEDIFLKNGDYWISRTIAFAQFQDGLAGYKNRTIESFDCNYSLLSGVSGIGLVLLSYLTNDSQSWDELFLLS